ncbi:MAG TPA: serine hydrolase domain-containing protein [Actinomycetota bacterium]
MAIPRAVGPVLVLWVIAARAAEMPPPAFQDPERKQKLESAYPAVDAAFRDAVERGETPAAVWGVVVDGALVHDGAAGLRDVPGKAPAERDTAFRIASLTKAFTAAAVLQLRDAGKLSLEDRVDRWIPELRGWPRPTQDAPPLTIRMLLTHGAGFAEDNPWGDRQLAITDALFGSWLKRGLLWSPSPGTAFEYSNTGFALLGRVVTKASGRRYRDWIDEKLLRPLGMGSTHWEVTDFVEAKRAHGYRKGDAGWEEEASLGDGAYGAMGGLVTTIPDLARWVAFQLSAWPPRDQADPGPLRRSSLREMQQLARATPITVRRETPDAPLLVTAGGYAYGLGASQTCWTGHLVGHTGGLPGWGSILRWLPGSGVGVVAMMNVTYGGPALGESMQEALLALHRSGGLTPRVTQPSTALREVMGQVNGLLARWDDGDARKLAAENFFLDTPLETRRKEFQELSSRHGPCRPDGALEAENALRGHWRLRCERGMVRFYATIAPVPPARLQQLHASSALPLDVRMASAAKSVATLASGWNEEAATKLLAAAVDRAKFRQQLGAVAALHGTCKPGEVVSGDGKTTATVRYDCTQVPVQTTLELDGASGRLTAVRFAKAEGTTCPD